MEPIILASSSPRRQEILKMLGIPFRVIMPTTEELFSSVLEPEDVQEIPWVLGADTLIVKDGKIYGKPQDQNEAESFLRTFQGSTHSVITAIILYNGRKKTTSSRVCKTEVTFAPMTDEEINWYLDTGEWHGAAGGYRIQSLASVFIKKIEGSQSCVTGLPIHELFDILKEQGYSILD